MRGKSRKENSASGAGFRFGVRRRVAASERRDMSRRSKARTRPRTQITGPAVRGGAGGHGSSGSRRRRWCRQKEIAASAIQRDRRKVGADVAAGILPAVEPWLPARRKNAHDLTDAVETFASASAWPHDFRAAGCRPLRQAGCLTLRGQPFAVGLVVAVPTAQGGVAGVGKKKLQRRRFNVAVAKYHVGFFILNPFLSYSVSKQSACIIIGR